MKLSSNNLYHFKSNVDVLKLILRFGFRHNLWEEKIPFKNSMQENFMVCFCDIKIQDTKYHREVYGDNAIVLTKEWGMSHGISPVRYIHSNSHGVQNNYLKSKNIYREIRHKTQDHEDTMLLDYIVFSSLLDSNKLPKLNIEKNIIDNVNLGNDMEELEKEFSDFIKSSDINGNKVATIKYLKTLLNRIFELHDELEKRDSYMRIYSDDFKHPNTQKLIENKILYDEKEWRSIKYPDINTAQKSITDKFLPPQNNLKFEDKDIVAILLKDLETLESVKDFIQNNETLIDPNLTISKLSLIDDYNES